MKKRTKGTKLSSHEILSIMHILFIFLTIIVRINMIF